MKQIVSKYQTVNVTFPRYAEPRRP